MKVILLLLSVVLLCLIRISSGQTVTNQHDLGYHGGSYIPPKMYVLASGGDDDGTWCDIAVGIITAAGGFGCVIKGGIPRKEYKSCNVGTTMPFTFNIEIDNPRSIATFVVQKKGCTDGMTVDRVYLKPSHFGVDNPNPDTDLRWTFNRWIKASDNIGLVFQYSNGNKVKKDAHFTTSSSSSAVSVVSPNDDYNDYNDYNDYDYDNSKWYNNIKNYYGYLLIFSLISNILLLICCNRNIYNKRNNNKNKIYHVVKGISTSDEENDENHKLCDKL